MLEHILFEVSVVAAATNTFTALGMETAGIVTGLPVILFLKTVVPLANKTVGRPHRIGKLTIPAILTFGRYEEVN